MEDAFGMEAALHAMLAHRLAEVGLKRGASSLSSRTPKRARSSIPSRSSRDPREAREPQSEAVRVRGAVTAEEKLRAWVDSKYTRIPLREKDAGSKLEALHTAGAPELPGQDNLREDAMLG